MNYTEVADFSNVSDAMRAYNLLTREGFDVDFHDVGRRLYVYYKTVDEVVEAESILDDHFINWGWTQDD